MFKFFRSLSVIATALMSQEAMAEGTSIPTRILQYKDVIIEQIVLKQPSIFSVYPKSATFYKICLDGQAFLFMDYDRSQSIAPSFKDGRPESCSVKLK